MTILAAYQNARLGKIAIAADSRGGWGHLSIDTEEKLIKVGDCWIGCGGWSGMISFLRTYTATGGRQGQPGGWLNSPSIEDFSTFLHGFIRWMPDERGFDPHFETSTERKSGVSGMEGSMLLISPPGLLFSGTMASPCRTETYWAIGMGDDIALGYMERFREEDEKDRVNDPIEVVRGACAAASRLAPGSCGGPIVTACLDLAPGTP